MRQVIDRVTCENCGQVFDYERLNVAQTITARIESLDEWLRSSGWDFQLVEGSSFQRLDNCPQCSAKRDEL